MAIPVLLMGPSGSGKSFSLRNYSKFTQGLGIIEVLKTKRLPFRAPDVKVYYCNEYNKIMAALLKWPASSLIIDDAGYLITDTFMRGHRNKSRDSVYELYNDIADYFYSLINFIAYELPDDKIVYFTMHEDRDEHGIRPKTIGKLLNDKIVIEGLLSVVIRSKCENGKHSFVVRNTGNDIAKTPDGMFTADEIDNDLLIVDNAIREYYGLNINSKENNNVPEPTDAR